MAPFLYDVLIIGGGTAGCAVALAITKCNPDATYLLIDDADPLKFKIGESLPPEATRLLRNLEPTLPTLLGKQVAAGMHHMCAGNASAWASPEIEERHSILNPFGHGWHLDRCAFDGLLRETVMNQAGMDNPPLRGLVKLKMTHIDKNVDGTWSLSTNSLSGDAPPATFHGRWIVDATGRRASVATKLGAKTLKPDSLLAFYAVFEASTLFSSTSAQTADNDNRTLIEAAPGGWFYSSRVPSSSPDYATTRIVAFHTHPSHPASKVARRREGSGLLDLIHSSTTHISSVLRKYAYEFPPGGGVPVCTAAGSSYLDKPCDVKERWVAVGDAAMAFDPLSSQGMMTALEMGYCVGMLLGTHLLKRGADGEYVYNGEDTGLEQIYRRIREEYNVHRAYYYSLGKARFPNEQFWQSV